MNVVTVNFTRVPWVGRGCLATETGGGVKHCYPIAKPARLGSRDEVVLRAETRKSRVACVVKRWTMR